MGKAAAARSSRGTTRQGSDAAETVSQNEGSAHTIKPHPSVVLTNNTYDSKTIHRLRDELEDLTEAKERADSRITQLEERAQYLEANARLSASMTSKENMDLKQKARKLEIELSTVVDERDALAEEIIRLKSEGPDTEVLDEARLLSSQLKEAWIRISNMKTSQEEKVQRLFKVQEANAKLTEDLAKAVDLRNTAQGAQGEQKRRWESEKKLYLEEIESLKDKVSKSSKEGGRQVLDWEQDKTRLRNNLKSERAAWDKEKKAFLDQIASLKIKVTSLSLQKSAPPEWTLEKHHLVEQCATLQSRLAVLESDRASNSGSNTTAFRKVEAEKSKLEKKVDALKAKLVEVMEHLKNMQAKPDKKPGRTAQKRQSKKPVSESEDEASEIEIVEEVATSQPLPPRGDRAKRKAAAKPVRYRQPDSSDDDDEEDVEMADDNDEEEDDDNDNEQEEKDLAKSKDVEVQNTIDQEKKEQRNDAVPSSPVRSHTRRTSAGRTQPATDEDSDPDFVPQVVIVKRAVKRSASPVAEPNPKKLSTSKKRSKQTEASAPMDTSSASASTDALPTQDTPTEAMPTAMADTSSTPTAASAATEGIGGSSTPMAATGKVKKKRKLLTGKGVHDIGDILLGPGSEMSSSAPSTGLHFSSTKGRAQAGGSALLNGSKLNPDKQVKLDMIKKQFVLPKARKPSPDR
ncbi:hypothetical protein BGX28_005985 [Mortierella sp. GBA30]|nr:hypothetical protein BGX28_005985 [Mortierella sp. GBA30]